MRKKVIIFGAGKNGKTLLDILGESNVYAFCDNYKGGRVAAKSIIGFSELKNANCQREYDIVLSTNQDDIRRQLQQEGITFWEAYGVTNNYFNQNLFVEMLDEKLYTQYAILEHFNGEIVRDHNWFRLSYLSEKNEKLVRAMRCDDIGTVEEILTSTYDEKSSDKCLFEDEYFECRPGMRLIARLIKAENIGTICVCDLACGHGEFLKNLKSAGIYCYGVEISEERCNYLRSIGIECKRGNLDIIDYSDGVFDYVTIMECLEHVKNPFNVLNEAYRLLKEGGLLFVTVPYGENCDSDMHVRQFYEEDLYSVAKICGYTDIRIMKLPYLNHTLNDNLLMCARKWNITSK